MTSLAIPRRAGTAAADELRAAVALLTRLHVGRDAATVDASTGAAAFGVAGMAIGATGGVAVLVVAPYAPLAAGALAVAAIALLTGALHLDGAADTADALAAGPGRAEDARRDPRLGAAGVVAATCFVLLDASLIATIATAHGAVVAAAASAVAGAGSRALAAVAPVVARGRVRAGGSGAWFARRVSRADAAVALASAAVVSLGIAVALRLPAIAVGATLGVGAAALAAEWLIRVRGALDGDGIGAIVETGFAAILLATAAALAIGSH